MSVPFFARHHGAMARRFIDQHVSLRRRADGSLEYDVLSVSFDDHEQDGFASFTRPPWWQRFPRPVEVAALRLWAILPRFVRSLLTPLGRLFGAHAVSGAVVRGPESVPGVAENARDGFEPLENHTGAAWVARFWPEQHRRSMAETRPEWLEDPDSDGQLWLVRSPWESLTLDDTFAALWAWVERDRSLDEQLRRARVAEVLTWTEGQALDWLHKTNDD